VTTYNTKVASGIRNVPQPDSADLLEVTIPIEWPAVALASGDLIRCVKLPAGVRCVDWSLISSDIDSGGSALAFSLGVENAGGTDLGTEVWGTAIAAAAGGVPTRNALAVCAQGDTTVDRWIDLKCTTIATTYAGSGKVADLVLKLSA
jgi:hypothetical protein